MKIVVCVKLAARIASHPVIDPSSGRLAVESLEWLSNEWDLYAAEEAIRLAESFGGSEVIAATVGNEQADATVRWCLAMGADRGIRVDAPADEPIAIASALSQAFASEEPELILTGAQSIDGLHSSTGAALAGLLGVPHIPYVTRIEEDGLPETAKVARELEGGAVELVETRLPAVLSIQTGINNPRYVTLRARKRGAERELRVDRPAERLVPASRVLETVLPPRGDRAAMLEGDSPEIARQISALVGARFG